MTKQLTNLLKCRISARLNSSAKNVKLKTYHICTCENVSEFKCNSLLTLFTTCIISSAEYAWISVDIVI